MNLFLLYSLYTVIIKFTYFLFMIRRFKMFGVLLRSISYNIRRKYIKRDLQTKMFNIFNIHDIRHIIT